MMSTENVKNILQKYNVWARAAEDFLARTKVEHQTYTLPEDREALQHMRVYWQEKYDELKLDLIPDPIYGNIDAPVCVVLINPGYSDIDRYNYCDVSDTVKNDVKKNFYDNKVSYKAEFLYSGEEEKKQLAVRQKVLLESYQMKPGALAYALDESFNTVKVTTLGGKKTTKTPGSYLWYNFFMNNVPREKRNLVMDLEFFPYHSEHFKVERWIRLEKEHPECRMAHSLLRDALIREFAEEGRIFVARNSAIKAYMMQDLQVPEKQICMFSSMRMILSKKNLKGDPETVQKLIELLDLQK